MKNFNLDLSQAVLNWTLSQGCKDFIVCAGSRNSPLVEILHEQKKVGQINVYSFFEERSAAYFALGLSKKNSRPTVVVTTSGTAVANLLPAAMEAFYSCHPLILLTADRPRAYRGSGAPQAVEQNNIFSNYAPTIDIANKDELSCELKQKLIQPLHLNVCFDEPLIDGKPKNFKLMDPVSQNEIQFTGIVSDRSLESLDFGSFTKPLVILSALKKENVEEVCALLNETQLPVYVEGHSHLAGSKRIKNRLFGGEKFVSRLVERGEVDSIIRIGGVPTLRLWRDLEKLRLPAYHFSHLPFTGLSYCSTTYPLYQMGAIVGLEFNGLDELIQEGLGCSNQIQQMILNFPQSEVGMLFHLMSQIPVEDQVFIGNSLPIRELDLIFSSGLNMECTSLYSQRGANGIDGLISTAAGVAEEYCTTWAVLGDLTTLYDLSGPWAFTGPLKRNLKVVIVNNGGGKIFSRVTGNSMFENQHDLKFAHWAKMWDLNYLQVDSEVPRLDQLREKQVIELIPDENQSKLFWNGYEG